MQPQNLTNGTELPKPDDSSKPQDLSKLPQLDKPKDQQASQQTDAEEKANADEQAAAQDTQETKESKDEEQTAQARRLAKIINSSAKVAVEAAKSIREAMGLKPDYKGGPLGAKLEADLMSTLRQAAKAYSDRTPPE